MKKTIALASGNELIIHQLGNGPETLLIILGFGYGKEQLTTLASELEDDFTLTLIELPFHAGKWNKGSYLPADIRQGIEQFVATGNKNTKDIHLLGHSLGARVWLKTLPLLSFIPASLTLVAPDGLGGRYTSWLDRLPVFAIGTLSKLLEEPGGLLRITGFLRRHSLINAFSSRYLQHQLRDPFYQRRLGGTLRSLPHFKIGNKELAFLAHIPNVNVLFGEHDGLVDSDKIQSAFTRLPKATVTLTKGGHGLPLKQLVAMLKKAVNQ